MTTKKFASQGDLEAKTISFTQLGEGLYAFTAEGDPNSGRTSVFENIQNDSTITLVQFSLDQFDKVGKS